MSEVINNGMAAYCLTCETAPPKHGLKTCERCLDLARARNATQRRKKRVTGACLVCSAPAIVGQTKCEKHRMDNLARSRARIAVLYPEGQRWKGIWQNFRLTRAQWEEKFRTQGECCAICKSTTPGRNARNWHTDHDHVTKAVRDILCHQCNSLLGHARDSVTILGAAIRYLDKHSRQLKAVP